MEGGLKIPPPPPLMFSLLAHTISKGARGDDSSCLTDDRYSKLHLKYSCKSLKLINFLNPKLWHKLYTRFVQQ